MVYIQTMGEMQVLLKTDWISIAIATLGAGVVLYCGWSARNEDPVLKKILYTLLVFITAMWGLCTYILLKY